MAYICDTSTIRDFECVQRIDILGKVLGKYIVPNQIHDEIRQYYDRTNLMVADGTTSGTIGIPPYQIVEMHPSSGTMEVPLDPDHALITYAKNLDACVIASDKEIRDICRLRGISFHGSLYIFKKAIEKKLIKKEEAEHLYREMKSKGRKLPSINFYNQYIKH